MEEKYINRAIVSPHWLPDGNSFWYRRYLSPGKFEFIFVDTIARGCRPAFDHQKLADGLRLHSEEEIDAQSLPFTWIDLAPDASSVRFVCSGKKWAFDSDGTLAEWDGSLNPSSPRLLAKERPSGQTKQAVTVNFVNHTGRTLSKYWITTRSDKGRLIARGRMRTMSGDWSTTSLEKSRRSTSRRRRAKIASSLTKALWRRRKHAKWSRRKKQRNRGKRTKTRSSTHSQFRSLSKTLMCGSETPMAKIQISFNGSEERPYDGSRVFISSESNFVVAWQYTPEENRELLLRESVPTDQLQPKVRTFRYLKPGDRVRIDRPRLFSQESKTEITTVDTLLQNPYDMHHVRWNQAGSEYRFIFNERGHQHLRLIAIEVSGNVNALVEESSETFIDYSQKLIHQVLPETDELIWASERDGFNHLYLYDLKTGSLKNQITKGDWNVHSVVSADEKSRRIWFQGYGIHADQDPYHAHLSLVNFDGTGLKVLTKGDGTHTWTCRWSSESKYFIDTWSRVDSAPQTALRSVETGEKLLHLEGNDGDLSELLSDGWIAPERFRAPGRDGKTPIYGVIIRPSDFSPLKRYPILEDIYAGPNLHETSLRLGTGC